MIPLSIIDFLDGLYYPYVLSVAGSLVKEELSKKNKSKNKERKKERKKAGRITGDGEEEEEERRKRNKLKLIF